VSRAKPPINMRRTELCLLPAVVACLGAVLIGCIDTRQSGGSNAAVYYGRLPGAYEICFYQGDDLATLTPSVACDRDGATAYSFNIIVQGGSDPNGASCEFEFAYEGPIGIAEDGTFQVPPLGENAEFSISGTIESGAADGSARRIGTPEGDCEILWTASIGPVCREDDEAMCALLFDCCDSILLVPPILEECLGVVDQCDGTACREVLSGYTQCPQPALCPADEDPLGACELLNECCSSIGISKPDLETCLETAAACDPNACEPLLAMYAQCTQSPDAGVPDASSGLAQ